MRILIATDAYSSIVNGVVTSVKILRKELMSMGHDVKILTLSSNRKSYYDEEEDAYFFGSFDFSKIYPDARFSPFHAMELIEDILKWQPEIIHSQSEFTTFRIARKISKKINVPIVHTYHTLYEQYTHYFSPNVTSGKYMVSKLSRYIAKRTKCIIVPTLKTEKVLNSYDINDNIFIVPTGLLMDKFERVFTDEEKNNLKIQLGIPENSKIIISIGRVGKEKNIEELLRYYHKAGLDNLYFVIVGDGPERKNLSELVREFNLGDKVIFTGLIPYEKLNIYYQMADLFVSASTSETQGLTYIEALSNGTPVLCRDDTCLEQTVINDYNGYRYINFDDFFNKLHYLLNNNEKHKKLSLNAREGSIENFSSKVFANRILDIYKKYI